MNVLSVDDDTKRAHRLVVKKLIKHLKPNEKENEEDDED
jgi:hypothetical protein